MAAEDGSIEEPRGAGNAPPPELSAPTVTTRAVVRTARELRAVSRLLELGLYALLAGSALAAGSAFAWADVPVLAAAVVLGALFAVRCGLVLALRRSIGQRLFAFHPSGLWIVLDQPPDELHPTWSFDLARPIVPRGPLLLPGLALLALASFQLLLLPASLVARLTSVHAEALAQGTGWLPLTVSVTHTRTGVLFLAWAVGLHLIASAAFDTRLARARLQGFLTGFGLLLAAIGLLQLSWGTRRIYGLWLPPGDQGGNTVFGPFPNRNHFATYLLVTTAAALGLLLARLERYRRRVGSHARMRRWLVGLQSREGIGLLYSFVPTAAGLAALTASGSRGGILAFLGGLIVAGGTLSVRRRRAAIAAVGLVLASAALWFGLGPLQTRFAKASAESAGRTLAWRDTLGRMSGLWVAGAGLNSFPRVMSRATVWRLPEGATAWREPYEASIAGGPRLGYRALTGLPGLAWYGHAHNDYLQMLVEAGLLGLSITFWAMVAVLRSAWREPWRLAAIAGVLLHSFVDFPLRMIPLGALFVVIAAAALPSTRPFSRSRASGRDLDPPS